MIRKYYSSEFNSSAFTSTLVKFHSKIYLYDLKKMKYEFHFWRLIRCRIYFWACTDFYRYMGHEMYAFHKLISDTLDYEAFNFKLNYDVNPFYWMVE